MKTERRLQLGADREGVLSITCKSQKNFMFDLSNIVRQGLFRFRDIFRCHNASFARVLRVATSRKAAAARSEERHHLGEFCGRDVSPTPYVATYAVASAHVTEAIEREGEFELHAIAEHYERRRGLAPDCGARHLAPKLRTESNVGVSHSQIGEWRARAEGLRATADRFVIPTAQEALRRAARNYDALADDAEALAKRPPA
jgi:hypothetical protein